MSFQYSEWAPYVPVAARRRQAALQIEKLRKKGQSVAPVRIEGRKIATTFWGKAWCDNLEGYREFDNRLPRGRTYVRNGSVIDLQIAPLEVKATVSGSSIYGVKVSVAAVPQAHWQSLCQDCAGSIDSLVELLQGRFSKGVMERICRQDTGLFPRPSEIKFACSCPDSASMCKHVASVLYGVGARLDQKPELLFELRAVDGKDLAANLSIALPLTKKGPAEGKVIDAAEDISALFGLEMAEADASVEAKGDAPAMSTATARARQSREGGRAETRNDRAAHQEAVGRKGAKPLHFAAKPVPSRSRARPKAKAMVKHKTRPK